MEKTMYEAPQVEVIEVAVEKGYATTGLETTADPASHYYNVD